MPIFKPVQEKDVKGKVREVFGYVMSCANKLCAPGSLSFDNY